MTVGQTNCSHDVILRFHFNLLRKINSVLCDSIDTSGKEPARPKQETQKM